MDTYATGLLLVVAGWSGVVVLMVWIYRRRRAARERARDERYRQMIGATLAARSGGGAADLAAAVGASVASAPSLAARRGARPIPPLDAASARGSVRLAPEGGEGVRSAGGIPAAGVPVMPSPSAAEGGRTPGTTDAREQALRMADALMALRPGGGAPSPVSQTPAIAAVAMRPRAPLLDAASRAMLLALRAAAPRHEVLIGPSLARLLDAPPGLSGVDRSLRLRQAAALAVDFAVCTRTLELVATIDLVGQGMPASERDLRQAAATQLEAAGVRHLVFDPVQLPRYPDLRAMIGLDTPAGGA